MPSYEYEIDEKSRAGSRFVSDVNDELRRARSVERASRKFTQQSVADKLKVNRSVVNRRFTGLENLTARTIGETLWAIGWQAEFRARKVGESGNNEPQWERVGETPGNDQQINAKPESTASIVDLQVT